MNTIKYCIPVKIENIFFYFISVRNTSYLVMLWLSLWNHQGSEWFGSIIIEYQGFCYSCLVALNLNRCSLSKSQIHAGSVQHTLEKTFRSFVCLSLKLQLTPYSKVTTAVYCESSRSGTQTCELVSKRFLVKTIDFIRHLNYKKRTSFRSCLQWCFPNCLAANRKMIIVSTSLRLTRDSLGKHFCLFNTTGWFL